MARRWPWLLILFAPLIPLWRAVFLGEGIGPFDHIRAMAPWNGPATSTPWDVLQADGVLQFYPWRDLVLSSWGRLEAPFWNPYQLAGTPLLANSQSGGFYPPHILLGLLHVPTAFAMALLAWFHLALAGTGAALLAGRFGGSKAGQALAGLSFGLSPFLLAWTALPSVPSTVAWIPWVLVAAHDALHGRKRGFVWLPVSLAMMILAGHLQFVAYGFMAVGLFSLIEAVRLRAWKPFGGVLAGIVASFALAAVHLAPVLDYSQYSHRRNVATEAGYHDYVLGAIQPYELAGVVVPDLVGLPTKFAAEEQGISAYWPALVKRGGNFAEGAIGVGVAVALGLGLLTRQRWRAGAALAAVGILALLLALGTPLNRLLYFSVPGWSSTGSPGRIGVLFVLAACVLAGAAIPDRWESKPQKEMALRILPGGLVALATAFYIIGKPALASWIPGTPPDLVSNVIDGMYRDAITMWVFALVSGMLCFAGWMRTGRSWLVVVPVLLATVLSLRTLVRTAPADLSTQGPAPTKRMAVLGNPWDLLNRANATLPPNTASISRIHDLAGYDSLLHRDTVGLLRDIDGEDPAPPANGNMMLVKRNADRQKLAAAGVTELWTPAGKETLDGPGRADVNGAPAEITAESLDSLAVKASGPGRLTLRDRNLPGWSVELDGKPATMEGTVWREVELPAGEHTVAFRYRPPGFGVGLVVSAVAWVAWCLLFAVWGRRNPPPEPIE